MSIPYELINNKFQFCVRGHNYVCLCVCKNVCVCMRVYVNVCMYVSVDKVDL